MPMPNLLNLPAVNYPDYTGLQISNQPGVGRITTGSNKNASRTRGQVKGAASAVQQVLPGLLNSIYGGMILQAPSVTQSNLGLLQNLGPQFAQADTAMQNIGREGQIASDLALLKGPGREITHETLLQQMMADPEYYTQRAQMAQRAGQLLGGLDPNNLTGAELTNAERAGNRINIGQGTANTGSNSAALKGALQFDDRLQRKRSMLSGVLSNLGNILPNFKTNTFNYAASTGETGRGSGQGQFQSSLENPQGIAANLASNAFGQAGSIAQNNAQIMHSNIPAWQQTLGAVYGGLNAIGSLAGGIRGGGK